MKYLVIGLHGELASGGISSITSTISVFDSQGNRLHWSNGLFVQDYDIREMLGQRAGNILCFNPEFEVAEVLLKEDPSIFEEYRNHMLDEETNAYLEVFRFRINKEEAAKLNEGRRYY